MILIPLTYFQVRDLLQKEPAERPLAQEILFHRLPEVSSDFQFQQNFVMVEHIYIKKFQVIFVKVWR